MQVDLYNGRKTLVVVAVVGGLSGACRSLSCDRI